MWQTTRRLIWLASILQGFAGCHTLHKSSSCSPGQGHHFDECAHRQTAQSLLSTGESLEAAGNNACVDAYFQACRFAWAELTEQSLGVSSSRGLELYNASLTKMLAAAQRFGRLDASAYLAVQSEGKIVQVPVVYHGFAWQATDFQRLYPPPQGHEPLLRRRYRCLGIGVPLVAERCRNSLDPIETRFFPEQSRFAATAVLRFAANDGPIADGSAAVLDFYNPLQFAGLDAGGNQVALAKDLTAPLAKTLETAPRTYFSGFISPGGEPATARLGFLEPYQPGKVPVVLIHGLFSDPQSWAGLMNDLRAAPGFTSRYQIWAFRYPTGQGFLQSAAVLRRELRAALQSLDPDQQDPALRQIVLIGHSMGGLIAKLQVAYSDGLVWSQLANRPLEQIATTPATRVFLADACYFEPLGSVCRVIFIASPHCGSLRSSELIGQCAARLVEPSPEQTEMHAQLMRDNPGVFNPLVERRFPTSLDMLAPSSPLLDAMRRMRLRPGVKLHNIVGVSHPISLSGPSDGVVSVHSAAHPGCQSELAIGSSHTTVHQSLQASAEILRILGCHE